jgi:hypothetical protein
MALLLMHPNQFLQLQTNRQMEMSCTGDVWRYDGDTWELVTENAEWARRFGHAVVSFKGSLHVIGGMDSGRKRLADV